MELHKTLGQFRPDNTIDSSAFQSFMAGELTQDQWTEYAAISDSKRCHEAHPRTYVQLSEPLRNYCMARVEDRLQYDATIAKRLGAWFAALQDAWLHNRERLGHYGWAASKIEGRAIGGAYAALCAARDRFALARIPEDDVRICLETKKRDAWARDKTRSA